MENKRLTEILNQLGLEDRAWVENNLIPISEVEKRLKASWDKAVENDKTAEGVTTWDLGDALEAIKNEQ